MSESSPPPTYAKVGETPADITNRLRIFVDAVEQKGVTEYDTEAGYVMRYVTDGRQFKVEGDEPVIERAEGIVEVMWKDAP